MQGASAQARVSGVRPATTIDPVTFLEDLKYQWIGNGKLLVCSVTGEGSILGERGASDMQVCKLLGIGTVRAKSMPLSQYLRTGYRV